VTLRWRKCRLSARAVVGAALAASAVLAAGCDSAPGRTSATSLPEAPTTIAPTSSTLSVPSTPSTSPSSSTAPRSTKATAPHRAPEVPAARVAAANAAIKRLTAHLGKGGVSIEVLDRKSGAMYRYGATGGMLSGSISKLYILEVLLLHHQRAGERLDDDESDLASEMIEHSDNEAANDLYERIGEGPALRRAASALGVHNTVPGPGIYWGFNRSSAGDYIALLRNLTRPGVLAKWARTFALRLLAEVEADQRWGVSAAADTGTVTRQKNGWLGASPDNFRWLVNSVGLITADGRPLLVAVLTQHGRDFASGVTLVEQLAQISVRTVTGR
jgi:hypothetical protein